MFFFLKITGTNYWTLELPFPKRETQPTEPQRSQPLINSSQINADAPKTRAYHVVPSPEHNAVTRGGRPPRVSGKQWQATHSTEWAVMTGEHPPPSRFLPSETLCGGFSETPPSPGTGKATIAPHRPQTEVGQSQPARSPWKNRTPSSGNRA